MWSGGSLWRLALCSLLVAAALAAARGDDEVPTETQCRPYIEKALKQLETGDAESDSADGEVSLLDETTDATSTEEGQVTDSGDSREDDIPLVEVADEPYISQSSIEELQVADDNDSKEEVQTGTQESSEGENESKQDDNDSKQDDSESKQDDGDSKQDEGDSKQEVDSKQDDEDSKEDEASTEEQTAEPEGVDELETQGDNYDTVEDNDSKEPSQVEKEDSKETSADDVSAEAVDTSEEAKEDDETKETIDGSHEKADESGENQEGDEESKENEVADQSAEETADSKEGDSEGEKAGSAETQEETTEDNDKSGEEKDESLDDQIQSDEDKKESEEDNKDSAEDKSESTEGGQDEKDSEKEESAEQSAEDDGGVETKSDEDASDVESTKAETEGSDEPEDESSQEGAPEEDLLLTVEIPENLRSRDHIVRILRLDEEASEAELTIEKSAEIVLRDLKRTYENSIKPLEALYKYRDLSNRHFGDPEIFSKPLVLFMGPWSGGKSSILNYLTGLEFTEWSLRTGAEPSPAYFNILMHGKEPEVLDGTQLAADWTFAGLQKFGQGLEERLRGLRYPSKILEKVNIVEIPGILEVRKQVSRVFPFNDACQWFIDRADIIFLVYDPSKLDVGPETEAILDQLKGRESQTRIVLNKADSVKPEELMRVQSALIWNISPLMSSAQPPVMYTASLWSMPFEAGAPVRLLQAQERELLRDLRHAIDKRIENKIASARRFAVRVRNHAKMVDCYLTTYYNHKTIFGNRKLIADAIIENPQNYHIYEGLSTLTNISRYDLPDPETYRDFFRLNPLFEFQQLSATCTYFRGCPITRLDVAIAYDLPELVGKYKKMVETAAPQGMPRS